MKENKRQQISMREALLRQDKISELLRKMGERKYHVPEVVKEYLEAGIILTEYDPDKGGYPDRNQI
jgi:hypothetical protein